MTREIADKLRALIDMAEKTSAGETSIIARDEKFKVVAVGVIATGDDAVSLKRWVDKRD